MKKPLTILLATGVCLLTLTAMNRNQKSFGQTISPTAFISTKILFSCLILSFLTILSACSEEEMPKYEISGTISNTTEIAVAQALVSLNNARGEVIASTSTDEKGRYRLSDVTPGSYELFIDKEGYLESSETVTVEGTDVFDATLLGGAK